MNSVSKCVRVEVGLLLLAGGGADECHALVTPLSWPDGTTFGGPPVFPRPATQAILRHVKAGECASDSFTAKTVLKGRLQRHNHCSF